MRFWWRAPSSRSISAWRSRFPVPVESDLVERSAIVYGTDEKHARIVQGANHMHGREIHLAENAEMAMVRGAGALEFLTNKDFSGTELSTPRKIRVGWTKGRD